VIAVTAHDPFKQSSKALNFTIQVLATGFVPAGSLTEARTLHADALLPGGKALLTGGINLTDAPVKGEVFDSASETFTATTGNMNTPRVSPTATALANGKILLAGGKDATGNASSSAELYDPASNTYTATSGSMTTERVYHTTTLLNDGMVLLTGGLDAAGNTTGVPVASAEIFDPATGKFTAVGNLAAGRFFQTATLLPSGKVLITGGIDASAAALASAELYDPSAKTFSTTAVNMNVHRAGHRATLLATGKVLVAGGAGFFSGQAAASAELYDPAADTFATTGTMITGRALYTATLLNDGQVLLAGGNSYFYNGELGFTLSAAELFNPGTGTFTSAADMGNARESHTAILLSNGKVLVAGGSNGTLGYSTTTTVLATAELF
jgi:hypothetical protein